MGQNTGCPLSDIRLLPDAGQWVKYPLALLWPCTSLLGPVPTWRHRSERVPEWGSMETQQGGGVEESLLPLTSMLGPGLSCASCRSIGQCRSWHEHKGHLGFIPWPPHHTTRGPTLTLASYGLAWDLGWDL